MKAPACATWPLPLVLAVSMSSATAGSWTCRYGDLTRQVLTVYPNPSAALPCEVYYSKPTEKTIPRALWRAKHDADFCERRAFRFVQQLESWGWACTADQADAPPGGDDEKSSAESAETQ